MSVIIIFPYDKKHIPMYKEYQLVPIIIKLPYCDSPHDTILIISPY